MPALPVTSPVPQPDFMPQISAVPPSSPDEQHQGVTADTSNAPFKKRHYSSFALPKLRLEIRDLTHAGSKTFLDSIAPSTALELAVEGVLKLLYLSPHVPNNIVPGTRSVTLIIRSMEGVAYTTGNDLDSDHKEIHFSADYVEGIASARKKDEIMGVLTHEMVHCYQYNGNGACPSGLIEGIADWVRLKCSLGPPHWRREWDEDKKWDAGYQHTAYFLEYIENRYGEGTIRSLNAKLRTDRYEEKRFWTELVGRPVDQLWGDYGRSVKERGSNST